MDGGGWPSSPQCALAGQPAAAFVALEVLDDVLVEELLELDELLLDELDPLDPDEESLPDEVEAAEVLEPESDLAAPFVEPLADPFFEPDFAPSARESVR